MARLYRLACRQAPGPRPASPTSFQTLDFRPRSWLNVSSEVRADVEHGSLTYANHALSIAPNDVWSLSLGHLYVREDPIYGLNSGTSLIRSSLYYKFNENWACRLTHHYEIETSTMQEQYYSI